MWMEVYLYYLYHKSERKYVDIGKLDLARNTLNIGTSVIYIFPKALNFNTVHVVYMLCINMRVPSQSSVLHVYVCVPCVCTYMYVCLCVLRTVIIPAHVFQLNSTMPAILLDNTVSN